MNFSRVFATNLSLAVLMVIAWTFNYYVASTVRYSVFGEAPANPVTSATPAIPAPAAPAVPAPSV